MAKHGSGGLAVAQMDLPEIRRLRQELEDAEVGLLHQEELRLVGELTEVRARLADLCQQNREPLPEGPAGHNEQPARGKLKRFARSGAKPGPGGNGKPLSLKEAIRKALEADGGALTIAELTERVESQGYDAAGASPKILRARVGVSVCDRRLFAHAGPGRNAGYVLAAKE